MHREPPRTSLAQATVQELFASADVRFGGGRPWDIRVNDERFFRTVLAGGTLGLGESYIDGWWDCDALDEMCCRALRARLEERVLLNLHTALAMAGSFLFNLQTRKRARLVGKRHYDVGNDFFECMLDPAMQYSCAWFRGTDELAQAQREKMDLICRKLELREGMSLLDIGCGWGGSPDMRRNIMDAALSGSPSPNSSAAMRRTFVAAFRSKSASRTIVR